MAPAEAVGQTPRGFELVRAPGVSIVAEHRPGRADVHRLPAWKLVVTLDGWTEVTTDDGRLRGRAVLVPPGVVNASHSTGSFVAVFVDSWLLGPGASSRVTDLGARRGDAVAEAARVALDGGGTAALRSVAAEVLDCAPPPVASLAATLTPATTIDELAARGGISIQHLRRLLRADLGTSFSELSRWTRIQAAFEGLGATPIAAAAAGAGFADQPHFTRVARAMVGRTPGSLAR